MATIIITGSGKRIGRSLAIEFATKGYDIIVHYNNSKNKADETCHEISSIGRKVYSMKADLGNPHDIESMFHKIKQLSMVPDILVNNAGIFPGRKKISDMGVVEWDEALNVNLRSQFLCSKDFISLNPAGGRIINIASLGALEVWKERTPYNVSKAGVVQLTKSMARDLAPEFSVNCVCPGAISIPGEQGPGDGNMARLNKIPMGRYGLPKDVFDAVYFFATASKYITGQTLTVDGAYHLCR